MRAPTWPRLTLLLLGALVLAAPWAALAQTADPPPPPAEEPADDATATEDEGEIHGEIVVGPQYYVDEDNPNSAKFEEFREVPNGFVASRFVLSWIPNQQFFFHLDGVDLTQDDQRIVTTFGNRDDWQGQVYWLENPRRWTDNASMLFSMNVPGVFTLEDSFQSAVRAAPASSLPGGDANNDGQWDPGSKGFLVDNAIAQSASFVYVGHQRDVGGGRFQIYPNRHWTFDVVAERERRQGTTPQNLGMYFSFAPAEVAAPLDFRTDYVGTGLEYASRRFNAAVQVAGSSFDTGYTSLTWDNQMFLVDEPINANSANPGHGRMTFATNNTWQRVGFRGGVNLPGRTRIDASAATSRTQQDDPFLPMTINTLLTTAPLPAASLDGEYRTDVYDVRLSSRPLRNWRFKAWVRSYEVDNRTPSLVFQDTVTADYSIPLCGNVNLPCDANNNNLLDDRIPRRSLPYDYERQNAGAQVGWSPLSWLDASLGYEREDYERDHAAVESSSEDIYKATLDLDPTAWLNLRATARVQERRAEDYHAHYLEESFPNGEPNVAAFNVGSRRYYWTDRDRDSWSVQFDVTPAERWSIYGELSAYDDDYFDPLTGQPIGTQTTVSEDRNLDGTPESYNILLAGRTESQGEAQALGVAWNPRPLFNVYADFTHEQWDYALASRYRNVSAGVGTDNPLDDWSSAADDDYDTWNLGFFWRPKSDSPWSLRGDASWSKGTSLITTDFVPGGSASGDTTLTSFPEVSARLSMATLDLTRRARRNLEYSLRYWYESWNEENFASDFNQPYMGDPNADPSMANAVFLGIDFEDYTNHIVSFLVRYTY